MSRHISFLDKPIKPLEPSKVHRIDILLGKRECGSYDTLYVKDLPEGTDYINIDRITGSGDCAYYESPSVNMEFYKINEVEDENYDAKIKRYNREMVKYEKQMEEWEKATKEQEEKVKKQEEQREQETYKKFKEKFEGTNDE